MIRCLLVALIRFYQIVLSPLKPPCCRFHPSCSDYFIQAVGLHGPFRGSLLGLFRILRCNPLCRGGYDPPPEPAGKGMAREDGEGAER